MGSDRSTGSGDNRLGFFGLTENGTFVVFLILNIVLLAWIAMLVIGAVWHIFDVGSPIGFLASLPIAVGLIIGVFLFGRARSS